MVINATYLAQTTRSSASWAEARTRVLGCYRHWLRAAPEIQTMYSIDKPVGQLRTKIRQEFERHRYVSHLPAVDMLIFQSNAEFQISHVMKYFRAEEDPSAKLPKNFVSGFLEGRN